MPHPILEDAITSNAPKRKLAAGVDLGFVSDGCGLVVVEQFDDRIDVVDCRLEIPKPGKPINPNTKTDEYMALLKDLGCANVVADVHYLEILRLASIKHGIVLHNAPIIDERIKSFVTMRYYIRARAITFAKEIAESLKKIEGTPKPGGGISITAPRTPGEGHADLASAIVGAVWLSQRLYGLIGQVKAKVDTHKGGFESP